MMSACLFLSYILHGDYYQALPLIPLIKLKTGVQTNDQVLWIPSVPHPGGCAMPVSG